jgi:hypothetical protein
MHGKIRRAALFAASAAGWSLAIAAELSHDRDLDRPGRGALLRDPGIATNAGRLDYAWNWNEPGGLRGAHASQTEPGRSDRKTPTVSASDPHSLTTKGERR